MHEDDAKKVTLRLSATVHGRLSKAAAKALVPLSEWVIEAARMRLDGELKPTPVSTPEVVEVQAELNREITERIEEIESRPVPQRSWAEVFDRCHALGEAGASEFAEAVAHVRGWPKGFRNWPQSRQVEWLDATFPLKS